MSTEQIDASFLGRESTLNLSGPWAGYWIGFLRLLTGFWFFHAGLHKYAVPEPFSAGWFVSQQGSIVSPIMNLFSSGIALEFVNVMIPFGELLIGLGLIVGALTRLAAFFGATLMFFFYFANQGWAHGFVNSDLMGLMLFMTVIVFGAGRVWGLDEYIEQQSVVENNPWLRYLLG